MFTWFYLTGSSINMSVWGKGVKVHSISLIYLQAGLLQRTGIQRVKIFRHEPNKAKPRDLVPA
jgi:hypothetical protein